jgi:hypothetical protein
MLDYTVLQPRRPWSKFRNLLASEGILFTEIGPLMLCWVNILHQANSVQKNRLKIGLFLLLYVATTIVNGAGGIENFKNLQYGVINVAEPQMKCPSGNVSKKIRVRKFYTFLGLNVVKLFIF